MFDVSKLRVAFEARSAMFDVDSVQLNSIRICVVGGFHRSYALITFRPIFRVQWDPEDGTNIRSRNVGHKPKKNDVG
jgi:hypothetical protein